MWLHYLHLHFGFPEQLGHVMAGVRCPDVFHCVAFLDVVVPVEIPALPERHDESHGDGEAEVDETQQAGQASENQQNAYSLFEKKTTTAPFLSQQKGSYLRCSLRG